ncbi:MAG: glycosyltransferase family 4 protein [Cyanothece sp. SIO2G6]|nr:glycosyltransferase family 4 protein [Cyanothece sp. SIO2G6]
MKVTFVLPPVNLSGGIRSTAMLAQHLMRRGHEVLAVCPANPRPTLREQLRSLKNFKGWLPNAPRQSSQFDDIDVPLKVLDSSDPITANDLPDADVVVATWWETAEWVVKLPPEKGAKAYFIRHHEVHDYLPKERSAATYALPLHKITISQWLVDIMKTHYGDDNVSLVPNSIDTSKYFSPIREKAAQPTVGMMYSTKKWKGCDVSLEACAIAARELADLKVLAFGFGDPAEEMPLPPNHEYVRQPPQDQIKQIYSACDAWLFGSRLEGFGRPILEAMACRTPVIGTPAGAAPELISHGGGILVKPEDPADMAQAIVKICTMTNADWQSTSQIAYDTAKSYTWDDAAQRCEAAFQAAIERFQSGDLSKSY